MSTDPMDRRAVAIKRINARRDFAGHAVVYVVFNLALAGVWYVTGHGYFWPGWILGLWGAGLLIHAWDVFGRRPISDDDIRRELGRSERPGRTHRFDH